MSGTMTNHRIRERTFRYFPGGDCLTFWDSLSRVADPWPVCTPGEVVLSDTSLVGRMKEPCGFNVGEIKERLTFHLTEDGINHTHCLQRQSAGVSSVGEMTFCETHH